MVAAPLCHAARPRKRVSNRQTDYWGVPLRVNCRQPPGYWCSTLGYFVPVRMITEEEGAWLRAEREERFTEPKAEG